MRIKGKVTYREESEDGTVSCWVEYPGRLMFQGEYNFKKGYVLITTHRNDKISNIYFYDKESEVKCWKDEDIVRLFSGEMDLKEARVKNAAAKIVFHRYQHRKFTERNKTAARLLALA